MIDQRYIDKLKQTLELKFPNTTFESSQIIEYQSRKNSQGSIVPLLYDSQKKIIVLIFDTYDPEVISDLYNYGYTPIVYKKEDIIHLYASDQPIQSDLQASSAETVEIYATTEIDDLIDKTPGWLLKSGILITTIVTLGLIIFSSLLKYPDKIVSRGILTSDHPPIKLKSKVDGKIEGLYVRTGDTISQGQKLIYIQNTASQKDVEALRNVLSELINAQGHIKNGMRIPGFLTLGMMQEDYGQLQLAYKAQQQLLKQDATALRLQAIENEVRSIDELNQKLQIQVLASQKERTILVKEFNRNAALLKEGLISEQELERSQLTLNQFDQNFEQLEKEIINNNINKQEIRLQSKLIRETNFEEIETANLRFVELRDRLNTTIENWEDAFTIYADESGVIELPITIEKNTFIETNSDLGTIRSVNQDTLSRFISSTIPSFRRGKIPVKAKVIIKFDAYPYKEFGSYITHLDRIATIPEFDNATQSSFYETIIHVDDDIITGHDNIIQTNPGMTATVEIITDDRSLLFRIMDSMIID